MRIRSVLPALGVAVTSVQVENDAFGFGDDHYTQGIRFAYVLRASELSRARRARLAATGASE